MGSKEAEAPRLYNHYEQTYTPKPLHFQILRKKKSLVTFHVSAPEELESSYPFCFDAYVKVISPLYLSPYVCGLV